MPSIVIYFKNIEVPISIAFNSAENRDGAHEKLRDVMIKGGVWSNGESTIVTSEIRAIMNRNVSL